MVTGKAISRAIRGHMLVDAALNAMLIAMAYDSPLPGTYALDRPHDGMQGATNVCSADVFCRIRHMTEMQKEALKQSRTACLWLQYMDMMDILRRLIKAERTANLDLHLHTTLFVRCFHTS